MTEDSGVEWRYLHPAGVTEVSVSGRPGWRTVQDGRVAGDDGLLALWRSSHEKTLHELLADAADPDHLRAALACLSEAGLLVRSGFRGPAIGRQPAPPSSLVVSVVLVTYDSEGWIAECLASLRQQTHTAMEVIVVDNGSPRDPVSTVKAANPNARYVRQPAGRSFASALNAGAALATGRALLFLNPDVALEADAVAQMVARLEASPRAAAVAAKLRFYWAPAFLNGIGNRVESFSWGTDNGIGHLDLGQFDDRTVVPSACFAAALISLAAWNAVGRVDEGFPMYYEDVEWCYRARRLGFDIVSAPEAIVYHAFGSRLATGDEPGLSPRKLAHVAYGRLRFISTVFDGATRRRFRRSYVREDISNYRASVKAGDSATAAAYRRAWWRAAIRLPQWHLKALGLARRAKVDAARLALADTNWPAGLTWQGVPELTEAIVRTTYLPIFRSGRARVVPEWNT